MGLKFVIDTSAYSEFERKNLKMAKYMNTVNGMHIPVIVIGELRGGFRHGNKNDLNESLLRGFLDMANVSILKITEKTTEIYADIYSDLRKNGKPIGTNDIWIAAICIENNLPLLTVDSDFCKIDGLNLLEV